MSVASLSGLVDVAIDCNRRVIEDEECGGFYVVDGDVTYAFDSDSDPDDRDPIPEDGATTPTARDEFEWKVSETSDGAAPVFEWSESTTEEREEP